MSLNPITDIVAAIIKPISDVIDHIVVSGEDKAKLEMARVEIAANALQTASDYESKLLQGHIDIVESEAKSEGWLTRSWRPITMLTFLGLVVCDSFGWLPNRLAPQAWELLQIGLGGYVIGRSAEKVLPAVSDAIKTITGAPSK